MNLSRANPVNALHALLLAVVTLLGIDACRGTARSNPAAAPQHEVPKQAVPSTPKSGVDAGGYDAGVANDMDTTVCLSRGCREMNALSERLLGDTLVRAKAVCAKTAPAIRKSCIDAALQLETEERCFGAWALD